jgi:hypothetical protein
MKIILGLDPEFVTLSSSRDFSPDPERTAGDFEINVSNGFPYIQIRR